MLLALLVILALVFLLGGGVAHRTGNQPYGYGGIGVGGIVLLILVVLLLTGSLHA